MKTKKPPNPPRRGNDNNLNPSGEKKGVFDRRKLWSYFDKNRQTHKYLLSLCIQYGWSKTHPKSGREVADLGALDKWLKGKHKSGQSPVQKPLMDMNPFELSRVITALENMVQKKYAPKPPKGD